MPFVKRGDLIVGGSDTAVVLEVHTSQEPHMSSQLVLDGNPVECTAHYVASLLLEGEPCRYKFEVRFWWESRGCRVEGVTLRRVGTHDPWSPVQILR